MISVLHDRYVQYGHDRVCDLVTGDSARLIDISMQDEQEDERSVAPLVELLEHGRDGSPRWLIADVRSVAHAAVMRKRAAAAARRLGFIAMSAGPVRRWRAQLESVLPDRALLLFGGFGEPPDTAQADLVWAATVSPRPHVLITFRHMRRSNPLLFAREARVAYGASSAAVAARPVWTGEVARQMERAARATIFMREGRHAAAERLLRDVAGSLERRRAGEAAAEVLLTLGTFLLERGRTARAEAQCREAAALADAAGAGALAHTARTWQAWARTDLGHFTEAESLLRALLLTADPAAPRALTEAALARCLSAQDRVPEARDAIAAEHDLSQAGPLHNALTHDVAVQVALASGEIFKAGQRGRVAIDAAGLDSDPLVSIIACTSQLRVLCAAGDLKMARPAFEQLVRLASRAHAPCRATTARVIWMEALLRAGIHSEARQLAERLRRVAAVSPPLVRRAIAAASIATGPVARPRTGGMPATPDLARELVAIAHQHDGDRGAVQAVIECMLRRLSASRIEVLSGDAGPVTRLLGAGHGLSTTLGPRIIESGIAIGFEPGSSEVGVPLRLGARLLGSLTCRWPVDRTIPSSGQTDLELAAAILAPRVEGLLLMARQDAAASVEIPELVGTSGAMDDVRRAIGRAARAPFAVLIEGESGTGKELVARAIHQLGPRRDRRFCDVNCAALPDDLLESELFGHARGAFTGALVERAGLFEEANGGTLFMDELADLSPRGQAKLLRVVQQQEVRRVGETFSRAIDVRLIAAANRDMHAEASGGRFRQDLLYRIDVIRIRLPPLRERPADVSALAQHFWTSAAARIGSKATLTPAVLADLARYPWPGNVRELQNVMSALAVAAPPRGRVSSALLPPVIGAAAHVSALRLAEARQQFDRRFIEAALAAAGGSRTRAATALGVSRQGLLKLLLRLGLAAAGECAESSDHV